VSLTVERVFLPSAIRRGRLATSPTYIVRVHALIEWRFHRKRDADAFARRDGMCVSVLGHAGTDWCGHCRGVQYRKKLTFTEDEG